MNATAQPLRSYFQRHALLAVGLAPLIAQLIGSAFNIWYNRLHIEPLLTAGQYESFLRVIAVFNVAVYPAGVLWWVLILRSVARVHRRLLRGEDVPPDRLVAAQRRTVHLPWWLGVVAGTCWLLCVPAFLWQLASGDDVVAGAVLMHLPLSLLIGGSIAVTQGILAVELCCVAFLYPVMFQNVTPSRLPRTWSFSLTGRGMLWAFTAVVCPILALLLILVSPERSSADTEFAIAVAGVAIMLSLATAVMLRELVVKPVTGLRQAAREVAEGSTTAHVDLLRADEFGPLIDEFNHMVCELREKERLRETFGLHVGEEAARQILSRDPGLGGVEQVLTVMFVDVRNYTARSSGLSADRVVGLLNTFFTHAVDVVEQHGGLINKFLGDGFMALFGIEGRSRDHAERAILAGRSLLERMDDVNAQLQLEGDSRLEIGIGVHTGPAVIGCVGSDRRMEFTAIGDTVNVASRIEALTKNLGERMLVSDSTQQALGNVMELNALEPQAVKGKAEPIPVFSAGS